MPNAILVPSRKAQQTEKSGARAEIVNQIIERSPAIAIRIDERGERRRILFATGNVSAYGYDRNDFLSGKVTWSDVVHPDDLPRLKETVRGLVASGSDRYSITYRAVKANGKSVWVLESGAMIRDAGGEVAYSDCVVTDYSETRHSLERVGENYRQQSIINRILQSLHDSNLDKALQIILDSTGAYLDISRVLLFEDLPDHKSCRAVHEWCNKGIPSLLERGDHSLNYREAIPEIERELEEVGRCIVNYDDIPASSREEFDNEGVISSAIYAVTVDDEPYGMICFDECVRKREWTEDIIRFLDNVSSLIAPAISRKKHERIISELAITDQLTGLYNRRHLDACLNDAIKKSQSDGRSGYVLFLDFDDFKVINDAYGHDYGDAMLREAAAFLREHFANNRSIFRFGGDEFVILIDPDMSVDIYPMVSALLARGQMPWHVLDQVVYCTLSIGVVRFPEADADSGVIVKNADIAMYQAKKSGKNTYVFFTNTLDNDSLARAEIERDMREAIDNGFEGFETHFQPLADMDKKIIGVEALLRWTLPDGRRVTPEQFIPLAEYLGLVVPLGDFVLKSAVRLCRAVNRVFPDFFVSVNVSIRQFKQQNYLENLMATLEREGVRKKNVVLEITEGMAIQDLQRMKILATELRKAGVLISMDDFGTGYSSLGNMRELPIDVVKIDRAFIHDVTTDPYSKSFIRFISDLVHAIGRKVCIEGVETAAQFKYCRESKADYVQGYYLWRPMPAHELLEAMGLERGK